MSLENTEEHPIAYLINLKNGEKHGIKRRQNPYVIGRNQNSSLLIEEPYISSIHCLITNTRDRVFTLHDNHTKNGTFVNNELLPKGKDLILDYGDIIGFGLEKKLNNIYKFVPNQDNIQLNEDHTIEDLEKEAAKHKRVMESLATALAKLKSDSIIHFEEQVSKLAKFEIIMGIMVPYVEELKKKVKTKETLQREFKHEMVRILKYNFQCSVCGEVVSKASISNCSHLFCENCFSEWIKRDSLCPICTERMHSTSNCLVIDNSINKVMELLNGKKHSSNRQGNE